MSKIYMIGERNGKKYGAQVDKTGAAVLDNSVEITKAEYRRHRAAGVPSWGEEQTAKARALHRDPKRASRWAARAAKARKEARDMENERLMDLQRRKAKADTERAQITA